MLVQKMSINSNFAKEFWFYESGKTVACGKLIDLLFPERLRELGYRVDLNPVKYVNYCMVEMCGYAVFTCNLLHLKYNTQCRRDEVCTRAVAAIVDASERFSAARLRLWMNHMLDDSMFKRTQFAASDYWVDTIEDLPPFIPDNTCPGGCQQQQCWISLWKNTKTWKGDYEKRKSAEFSFITETPACTSPSST